MIAEYEWSGRRGPSLLALLGDAPVVLDRDGVRAAFGEMETTDRSWIAGARIRMRPTPSRERGSLREGLAHACASLPAGRVALALSGGVDSAVLAALLGDRVTAYTLVTGLPGYDEAAEAEAVARGLRVAHRFVEVGALDYARALPRAVRACERPLYNVHPVSRLLLAEAVRADGFDVLVTGDGADQVFRGTSGADYLPIVDALARAATLTPFAPFLHPSVASSARRDPEKAELRALAVSLGVPADVATRAKVPRYAPRVDLDAHWDEGRVTALACSLGRAPSRDTDRAYVGWTTLSLASRLVPGLALACAA